MHVRSGDGLKGEKIGRRIEGGEKKSGKRNGIIEGEGESLQRLYHHGGEDEGVDDKSTGERERLLETKLLERLHSGMVGEEKRSGDGLREEKTGDGLRGERREKHEFLFEETEKRNGRGERSLGRYNTFVSNKSTTNSTGREEVGAMVIQSMPWFKFGGEKRKRREVVRGS